MIGSSFKELVFIRVCIFVLEHSIHICILGLVLTGLVTHALSNNGQPTPASAIIALCGFGAILAMETLFSLTLYLPYRSRLRQEAKHPPPLSRSQREALFRKCFANVPNPDKYLRQWFLGAEAEDIKRDNMCEFILWAFFDRDGEVFGKDEDDEIREELDHYLEEAERRLGRRLEEGRGSARCLRLTLDAVETRYRSVFWFGIVGLVDFITHVSLVRAGFRYHTPPVGKRLAVFPPRPHTWLPSGRLQERSASSELGYWLRPHTAAKSIPVVFIHGIGIGLWAYTKFLAEIDGGSAGDDGQVGVLALELLPISMRLASEPLGRQSFLDEVSAILAHHGWDSFVLVSHSYGSVLTTHMVRSPTVGPKIDSIVLIDPVSLLLHLPDVAFNFTRRLPRRANEWQLWYFASMDPGTAHTLGRHFFWQENVIWKEELLQRRDPHMLHGDGTEAGEVEHEEQKRKVAVCLAGSDLIVDTCTVEKYLCCAGDFDEMDSEDEAAITEIGLETSGIQSLSAPGAEQQGLRPTHHLSRSGLELLFSPGLDHAQVFDSRDDRARVLEVLRRYSCAG